MDQKDLLVLKMLWEEAGRATYVSVYPEDVGEKLGLSQEQARKIVHSLVEKGFLRYSTFGRVLVTDQGLKEITR